MPRPPKLCRLLPLLLLLASLPAHAVRVEGLYRAEVEVVDKGSEARTEGFRAALEQVLVKVSGDSGVPDEEALAPVLSQPARYVQQYRYREIEDAPDAGGDTDTGNAQGDPAADVEDAEPAPQYRLQVVFARRQIEALLEEREIPVWDVYRPQVLVWLAFDDGERRTLVAADDESEADEALREVARQRGLPLLLPLLDMEDQRRVEYLDIQGGFLGRVREASARYNAGLVLIGHVYRTGGDWRGEWTLLEGDDRSGWTSRAEDETAVVHAGIGALADRLASRMAGREGEARRVRIRVDAAATLDDYARLGRYFERLPRVDGHRIVRVRPDQLLFELSLRGQLSDLERAIAVDDLLEPVRPAAGEGSTGVQVLSGDVVSTVGTGAAGGTATADGAGDADAGEPGTGTAAGGPLPGQSPGATAVPAAAEGEADLVYRIAG